MKIANSIQLMHDLNNISTFISRLYSLIGRRAAERLGIESGWLALFCSNSLRIRRALNEEIRNLGISLQHWIELQRIRKMRNRLVHPECSISNLSYAINSRWRRHRGFYALRSMVRILRTSANVSAAPAFLPSPMTDRLQKDWRVRSNEQEEAPGPPSPQLPSVSLQSVPSCLPHEEEAGTSAPSLEPVGKVVEGLAGEVAEETFQERLRAPGEEPTGYSRDSRTCCRGSRSSGRVRSASLPPTPREARSGWRRAQRRLSTVLGGRRLRYRSGSIEAYK